MVEHVYRRTAEARTVDVVLVATDDSRVADVVDQIGGIAVMTDAEHATGTDRLAEVARSLTCDLVVNVQGDEPMITGEAIDAAVCEGRGMDCFVASLLAMTAGKAWICRR
jgi:3-deoxy-manno-octulosonate cytidylyltransferase (CMP-KDO synthetase)